MTSAKTAAKAPQRAMVGGGSLKVLDATIGSGFMQGTGKVKHTFMFHYHTTLYGPVGPYLLLRASGFEAHTQHKRVGEERETAGGL